MSRAQYLKSLEREMHAAAKIIDELTRENYELRQMLAHSTKQPGTQNAKPKDKAF